MYTFTVFLLEPKFRAILCLTETTGMTTETAPEWPYRYGISICISHGPLPVAKIFYRGTVRSKKLESYKREIQILYLLTHGLKSIHLKIII